MNNEQKLKKTNILFHSIKKHEDLKRIINDRGFKASYADEIVDGYKVKILMVSFSNVALLESKSQINYGDFSIGLTREWGQINKLEPVIYTYENSEIGTSFLEIITIAGRKLASSATDLDSTDPLSTVFDNCINMTMYLKPIKVINNEGKEFTAFNDREWRFVHKHGRINPLIFERNFITNELITAFKSKDLKKKPFTNEVVLTFDLSDLKYIIIKEKSQKKEIFELLSTTFSYETVLDAIINGDLEILSSDSIWHDL
ncbi:abortive infection system antitoxin AbiGi family protein [Flavobacterium sp. XS1P32]|uniref:abortive infection system antitoxin AbiGi family protein n=1 Tax=Flavobacterium sp. XS1P32 TaxID=3401726 RepID=UPI003AB0B693